MFHTKRTPLALAAVLITLANAAPSPARAAANLVATVTACTNNTNGGRTTTAKICNTGNAVSLATTAKVGYKCSTASGWTTVNVPPLAAGACVFYTYRSSVKCCCFASVGSSYSSICPADGASLGGAPPDDASAANSTRPGSAGGPFFSEPSGATVHATWGALKILYR